jgi:ABC-type iron transport system FetAB permease component
MNLRDEHSRENRDKVEIYLAFGATRLEACRSIAKVALKMALMAVINKMKCNINSATVFFFC